MPAADQWNLENNIFDAGDFTWIDILVAKTQFFYSISYIQIQYSIEYPGEEKNFKKNVYIPILAGSY